MISHGAEEPWYPMKWPGFEGDFAGELLLVTTCYHSSFPIAMNPTNPTLASTRVLVGIGVPQWKPEAQRP